MSDILLEAQNFRNHLSTSVLTLLGNSRALCVHFRMGWLANQSKSVKVLTFD